LRAVAQRGSEHRDELTPRRVRQQSRRRHPRRHLLRSIDRGARRLKPTSSIQVPGRTIDLEGRAVEVVTTGRHDPCVGLRATPIAEAMLAIVLMDHCLRHRAHVAVVGVSSLIGDALLEELRARKMTFAELHALDDVRRIGATVADDDGKRAVGDVATFDFSRVDLAFFCGRSALAELYAEAAAAHAWVIDGSAAFRERADVPLVAADVNPQALEAVASRGLIALPGSASVALATVLAPLHALAGLVRAEVATYQAVSGSGRGAMDELAGETVAMLSGKKARGRAFGRQIAFNVIPQVDVAGCRRGVARGASSVAGDSPGAGFAAARDQCDGGAGAGVLRPQPGGARQLSTRHQ
jgi:hypothetical protein